MKIYLYIIILSILIFPQIVFAYLDPGTGSLIIQIILGIIFGIGLGIRIFWSKIKQFFSIIFKKNKNNN